MDYKALLNAIQHRIPLVWCDPDPIEGNDYTIISISGLPEGDDVNDVLDDSEIWEDWILLVQYGGGSEAEVLPREIDFKTIVTDPSCNQTCRQIDVNEFEFSEDRTIDPETGETERVTATINLEDYTGDEMWKDVQSFGYTREQMNDWLESDDARNRALVAECIFEMS